MVVIVGGCLDADEAYASLRWPMLMLIFGSLALGKAMETSGAAQLVVDGVMHADRGPEPGRDPLGHLSADDDPDRVPEQQRDRDPAHADRDRPRRMASASIPRPFVVAVMLAASNAFATPIGYQTNTFVYNAGGYKFADFVKIGLPLNIITWLAASFLIPFFFPL